MNAWIRTVAVACAVVAACGHSSPGLAGSAKDVEPEIGSPAPGCESGPATRCACGSSDSGESGGRFGVELLDAVSGSGQANTLISPIGIRIVLAMLAYGASEPTRRSIQVLLGDGAVAQATAVDELAGPAVGSEFQAALACRLAAVRAAAGADSGIAMNVASAAFVDTRLDLYLSFAAALEDRFGARAERLDFEEAGAVERINAWVSQETGGSIPALVSSLDPTGALLLVNALHFRGIWSEPFDPALTAPMPFQPHAGTVADVPTMTAVEISARYREDSEFQAASLAFGEGGFEAVVVLPRRGLEPAAALRALASDPSWLGVEGFRAMRGSLTLPQLLLEEDASILPALRKLGFGDAGNGGNSFAGIAAPPPTLDRVIQRTVLHLDEQGTEASAVTAAVLSVRSMPDEEEVFELRVDRPFALAVRHSSTGALLFLAWVARPPAYR